MSKSYEIFVAKEYFKFNAAHFQAYAGFRERLHGHNYHVSVRIEGPLGKDGYVVDFGDIKKATRAVCQELDERVMIPAASEVLEISRSGAEVIVVCEDGTRFSFPATDCVLLPITHTSAEELAGHICRLLIERLDVLGRRGVTAVEVAVEEAPGQEARFRQEL
jgi:6-pyruvoyltetrahydropterin/6-carboxytetrahydropterin synthase